MNKVYLALPSHFPKIHETNLQQIISFIKENPKVELTADFNWFNSSKKRNDDDYYEAGVDAIENSDFVVAEISYASSGVGFQIAYSLAKKKKVLCLYKDTLNRTVSKFLKSLPENHVKIVKYDNDNLVRMLTKYFSLTKPFKLHKFNFIISEKIKDYIKWLGKEQSHSVSEKLRFLVEKKIIDPDMDYQRYQQE